MGASMKWRKSDAYADGAGRWHAIVSVSAPAFDWDAPRSDAARLEDARAHAERLARSALLESLVIRERRSGERERGARARMRAYLRSVPPRVSATFGPLHPGPVGPWACVHVEEQPA